VNCYSEGHEIESVSGTFGCARAEARGRLEIKVLSSQGVLSMVIACVGRTMGKEL